MELFYGFSEKQHGQMNLKTKTGRRNRRNFFTLLDINSQNVVACMLDHDKNVETVNHDHGGEIVRDTDGLITKEKNLCLCVAMADCLPIIFFDNQKEVIGIAHAGWKGVVKKIAINLVEKMHREFSSDYQNIGVYIGPHIQQCHFEVKKDVIDQFRNYPDMIAEEKPSHFIALGGIVKSQLTNHGLAADNIRISEECCYCNHNYFSNRRDNPDSEEIVRPGIAYIYMR